MRKLTPLLQELISANFYSTFYILHLRLPTSGGNFIDLRKITLPYDAVLGGETFVSDSSIISVTPPQINTAIDREEFKISLADPNFLYRSLCDEMTAGGKFTMRVGFFNTSSEQIESTNGLLVNHNEPILDLSDTLIIYKGLIDAVDYQIELNNGVVLNITSASPVAALDATNVFYSTKHSLQARIGQGIVDTCFDLMSLTSAPLEINWGKEETKLNQRDIFDPEF